MTGLVSLPETRVARVDPDLYTDSLITAEARLILPWLHGDELLAPAVADLAEADPQLAGKIDRPNFNLRASQSGLRFTDNGKDSSDANRSCGEPHPDTYEGRRAQYIIERIKQCHPEDGDTLLFDFHLTSTEREFAIARRREINSPSIRRMLGCTGMRTIVAFEDSLMNVMLVGRKDVLPERKLAIEYPKSETEAGAIAGVIMLRRALGFEPIVEEERQVFHVSGTIPKGVYLPNAKNLEPCEELGGRYPILYDCTGKPGSYSSDPRSKIWGFVADRVTSITC